MDTWMTQQEQDGGILCFSFSGFFLFGEVVAVCLLDLAARLFTSETPKGFCGHFTHPEVEESFNSIAFNCRGHACIMTYLYWKVVICLFCLQLLISSVNFGINANIMKRLKPMKGRGVGIILSPQRAACSVAACSGQLGLQSVQNIESDFPLLLILSQCDWGGGAAGLQCSSDGLILQHWLKTLTFTVNAAGYTFFYSVNHYCRKTWNVLWHHFGRYLEETKKCTAKQQKGWKCQMHNCFLQFDGGFVF